MYIPRNQQFADSRQFHFRPDPRCIAIKPFTNNIHNTKLKSIESYTVRVCCGGEKDYQV